MQFWSTLIYSVLYLLFLILLLSLGEYMTYIKEAMYKWLLKTNLYIDCKILNTNQTHRALKLTIILQWNDYENISSL